MPQRMPMQDKPAHRTRAHRRSDPGLDMHRGLAVVLMFLAHAWRVQNHDAVPPGLIGSIDRTLAWMDRGVAYVAASFLFVAGFSLVLAQRDAAARGNRGFPWGVLRRAGWLYVLSLLMFVPEHGLEWPDLIASSGILSVIAAAVAVTTLAMTLPRANVALALTSAGVLACTWWLEQTGATVSGLNAGPGGAVPLIMFSTLGAWTARLYLQHGIRPVLYVAAIATPAFLGALLHPTPWLALYTSTYADHGGLALAHWLGMTTPSQASVHVVFWNPSALGSVGLVAPVAATTTLLLAFQHRMAKSPFAQPLLLLGRHALLVFVGHYALLGLVDLAGLRPPHAGWTLVLLAGLTIACVAMAAGLQWWRNRQRAGQPRHSLA